MRAEDDMLGRFEALLAQRVAAAHRVAVERPTRPGGTSHPGGTSRPVPQGGLDHLIDQVHGVVRHLRIVEQRVHEREARVEHLLTDAEQRLRAVAERVRAAEERVDGVQSWAEREVAAAGQREATARERVRALEAMLARMREVVSGADPGAASAGERRASPTEAAVVRFGRPGSLPTGARAPILKSA